jgi:hypothetical protein
MLDHPDFLRDDQSNSWSPTEVRQKAPSLKFQTNVTLQQLARVGLHIVEPQLQNSPFLNEILGGGTNWNKIDPILVLAPNFDIIASGSEDQKPAKPTALWYLQFESRLTSLREIAAEEEISLSEKSLKGARAFAKGLQATRSPSTFLLANGNVRLLWANDAGEQIGLQFRDNAEIQYVFLRLKDGTLRHIMGIEQTAGIMEMIRVLGLRHLIVE